MIQKYNENNLCPPNTFISEPWPTFPPVIVLEKINQYEP